MLLESIKGPADIKQLSHAELTTLCSDIRSFIVDSVSKTGGHLGSNLGVVELTIALHRVFDSPRDIILWDTGHQAYVHKILTGRADQFKSLRQEHGMSGYPNRKESEHDWVENSHASTILSYAHGLSAALTIKSQIDSSSEVNKEDNSQIREEQRHVVALIGDGALTGGMAYEALNNLGHSKSKCIIILNDNGRSYAPTISRLSESITKLRLNPSYVHTRQKLRQMLRDLPAVGGIAYTSVHGLTAALREMVEPHVFFEALGVRYTGPIDGHDIEGMEHAFNNAKEWEDGPIVVHVLTEKGHGYGPAVEDEVQRLHDLKVSPTGKASINPITERASYTEAFSDALVNSASIDERIVAITAAMPGPTGLLKFQEKFPDRFFDVGIAEQHAVTCAAGMAMGGLKPVFCVYSTFFSRAFDQANLDVAMHGLPVIFVLDRAGITGDDGPSHHGILDLSLCLAIADMTIFAPSSIGELPNMLQSALGLNGPSAIRFPKTLGPILPLEQIGNGLDARKVTSPNQTNSPSLSDCAIIAIGKMVEPAIEAVSILSAEGISCTLWDPRVIRPADPEMIADVRRHRCIITIEDGIQVGGAGAYLSTLIMNSCDPSAVPAIRNLGVPGAYIPHAKPDAILADLGLDAIGIANSVRELHLNIQRSNMSN